jgi:membrane fusion protein (multidrug efflux system)
MLSPTRQTLLAVFVAAAFTACGKAPSEGAGDAKAASAPKTPTLLIAPEDLRTLGLSTYASGPVITGSIQPERRADLRAEVSAVVLQVLKENGDPVKRGDLLARLDDNSIRDSLGSAEEAARAAGQSFEQAERQYQRLKTLQAQGMSSMQAMEDAEIRRNNAQSDLVAAKARVATARQQLQRTEVRAPFDGVVSDRKVSAGDTAQVGKELLKVIDPTSMRFEGLVSADKLGELKIGQAVHFRVNGYGQTDFNGRIKRVDVAANATTRQVEVLVAFADASQPRAAGLYAEGRIESTATQTLMLPERSIVHAGDKASVWKLKGNTLAKVDVSLGERDQRLGEYVLRGGLSAGDRVLRSPGSNLTEGQQVEFAKAAGAAAASTATAGK